MIRDLGGDPAAPAPVSPSRRPAGQRPRLRDGRRASAEAHARRAAGHRRLVDAVAANSAWRAGWRQRRSRLGALAARPARQQLRAAALSAAVLPHAGVQPSSRTSRRCTAPGSRRRFARVGQRAHSAAGLFLRQPGQDCRRRSTRRRRRLEGSTSRRACCRTLLAVLESVEPRRTSTAVDDILYGWDGPGRRTSTPPSARCGRPAAGAHASTSCGPHHGTSRRPAGSDERINAQRSRWCRRRRAARAVPLARRRRASGSCRSTSDWHLTVKLQARRRGQRLLGNEHRAS